MSDPRYDKKILKLIVLDLAEIPIDKRYSHRPSLKRSDFSRVKAYIQQITAEVITPKTLSDYSKEARDGTRPSVHDCVAAAWLVAMKLEDKETFPAKTDGAFCRCAAEFKKRKALISKYTGLVY